MEVGRYKAAGLSEALPELITAYRCRRGNFTLVCRCVSLKYCLYHSEYKTLACDDFDELEVRVSVGCFYKQYQVNSHPIVHICTLESKIRICFQHPGHGSVSPGTFAGRCTSLHTVINL